MQSDTTPSFLRAARAGNLEKVLDLLNKKTNINGSNEVCFLFRLHFTYILNLTYQGYTCTIETTRKTRILKLVYSYVTATAMLLQWLCYCYGYITVTVMLMLRLSYCYSNVTTMVMLLLWLCCCYRNVTVTVMLMLWLSYSYSNVTVMLCFVTVTVTLMI